MSGGGEQATRSERDEALAALANARRDIERIDRDVIALLAERVTLSKEIGTLKRAAGLPTLDPAREAEVIRRAAGVAREHALPDEKVRDIFWHIIGLSRGAQTEGE